ncbi:MULTISPECIES: FxsA family protein [unclassified Haladaptatus]|uniref:FxsA family protein n=1 Tax=unclassified Haladaptatus TaxID=2622732 RepID=UPI0023E764E5|nr:MULTISPECIES: FxsA family protein [unclassified Haladaptatus]
MLLRIAAVLLLIPVLDAMLLVLLAGRIGGVATVALVVLTALIGMLLVRAEGRHTLRKISRKLESGTPPTDELLDGGLLLVAGALLLTPGIVTDLVGFIFIIPLTRIPIRMAVKRWFVTPYLDKRVNGFVTGNVYTGGFPNQDDDYDDDTVDVDGFSVESEADDERRGTGSHDSP